MTKLKGLVQRASSSCTIPTIVMLNYHFYPTLLIFPSSHRPGQVLEECREITRSLSVFPKDFHTLSLTFNFMCSTGENIGFFIEVMKGIVTCLQTYYPHLKVDRLDIRIHDLTTQVRRCSLPKFTQVKCLLVAVEFPTIYKIVAIAAL